MAKLTLSVNEQVVSRAKRYAKRQGVSVSEMVEVYLSAVADPSSSVTVNTPILKSLRGSLQKADIQDYREHLASRYR